MPDTISTSKDTARKTVLAQRDNLSPQAHGHQSAIACRTMLSIIAEHAPNIISCFLPIKSEIDTAPIINALHAQEIPICMPITGDFATPLTFRQYRHGDTLVEGPYKTREPSRTAEILHPDFLIIPLAGFDEQCYRLGYGGGYYDATIKELSIMHKIKTFGLAFECQKLPSIPKESHDMQLDGIVTEGRTYLR